MDENKALDDGMNDKSTPGLLNNYISFVGLAIGAAAFTSFALLFLVEVIAGSENPYSDLVIFIFIPSVLVFGLVITLAGALIERRRRLSRAPGDIKRYPTLDLNDPRRRRTLVLMICLGFIFLFMSAFGSYRAYEYTESVTFCGQACHSVMEPEYVAYQASPHARIRCVECHVGGGAEAYVRSKFTGVRQLYGVITGHYNRPIQTPVHNMRSAVETCQKCHWSEKYHGDVLKTFNHYGYDEANSLNRTRMYVKVGGGDPNSGAVGGIHWHMNISNEITFVSADDKRQIIPWVRMKDSTGKVVEYTAKDSPLSPREVADAPKRRMDCIDCHNRPAHVYLSPSQAVDRSLEAGRLDHELPFIKAKAVEALAGSYETNEQAVAAISDRLNEYYRSAYPEVAQTRSASIRTAIAEVQQIYQTYFFPEMKTDWRAHPNNIGHYNAQGCFRCHDGQHVSRDGEVIRNECAICHTTVDQSFNGSSMMPKDGVFQHPVSLGDKNTWQCASCHRGDRPFTHPLNLGDISQFQCAECHKNGTLTPDGK